MRVTAASLRELELAKPWHERLLLPLLRSLHGFGRLLTPTRNFEQLQQDLVQAGLLERLTVIDFLGLRFLAAAVSGGGIFLFTSPTRPLLSALLLAFAGFVVGLYAPNLWLKMQIGKRQKAITRALPDALDRMSICVDAGLSFEAAIQKVAAYGSDELAIEFGRTISEIRLGIPRSEALRHLVDRIGVPDVASFVAVLIQAEKLGTAVRDVLHVQSEQMRIRRRQRAEEAAQKAPIKMLIPLVIFIFPAMFAVILGPAIPRILAAFQ
jgi:tight adherence protein C